jgi:hypothetical protein
MLDYRLFCIDGAAHFTAVREIIALNDADALTQARAMKLPSKCELWHQGRLVAKLGVPQKA